MENLEHLITRSIRTYYKTKIIAPIVYVIFIIVITIFFPLPELIFPKTYETDQIVLGDMYDSNEMYARFKLTNLYFTGYTNKWLDRTTGYYYYTMIGSDCVVVLLDPNTCEQGIPVINSITIKGRVVFNSNSTRNLLSKLASDLSWNEDGIVASVSGYMINEPDATGFTVRVFKVVYVISLLIALLSIAAYILFITWPSLSPPVLKLGAYGKPKELLNQAEEELATLPQLATEDMFITEHYFIETSRYGVAIVPISAIIWIYKYSTLHKFLWHHFAISYTLYITAGKRHYIKCPKNIKSDIDGIMDYLLEANHNILVGFSEENRLKVEEIQKDFETFRKLHGFLSKEV